ncbi:gluconate 2-dehydrogenase subunit 3 family protein [Shewanella sp. C32]|uniref:Gluconate 2-dehydrogenase subunit 3 family protein n=1 Tax=Shewanella electrica TaxID=515560 RepID=A0ABT2FGN9_9GAMM|nr:gluconate 2-dehydrogenase subunit 3 family protein [Shewanella electrica]MCH1923301.1 gluconate 2-dehydrogenase subunit 3 family protein [Shewanella electrica]MCS4555398.1 gluconate 2-dehydrogenase subunit 3 family protein [Shewanella electrica]
MESRPDDSRRRFMKGALWMISATTLGTGVMLSPTASAASSLQDYKPVFFTPDEWAFVLAACDRLIPADDTGPSALEANVPIFIDLQMQGDFGQARDWYMKGPFFEAPAELGYQSPLTPAQTYQKGIAATNTYCRQTFSKSFAELSAEQQDQLLTLLQKDALKFDGVSAKQFFDFLLQNTKEGYFADPIHGGNKNMEPWKMIGFPGARASYLEWVDLHNVKYPMGPVSLNGDRG